jgi:hypothetical protein
MRWKASLIERRFWLFITARESIVVNVTLYPYDMEE